uniref:Uncharacterized protein n=1 Tax=Rhizophora mucronata TaxID=61149 RepID=A0A2P2PTV9_RHIMU
MSNGTEIKEKFSVVKIHIEELFSSFSGQHIKFLVYQ